VSTIDSLFSLPQYSLKQHEKNQLLVEELNRLTSYHCAHCDIYRHILDSLFPTLGKAGSYPEIPYLPVNMFKTTKLQSVPDNAVLKILTSSGTTSGDFSRIMLDKETSQLQTRALVSIVTSFIGSKRMPMIIIDSRKTMSAGDSLSARGAGLVGLSNFGYDHFFALDDDMRLNKQGLRAYLDKHHDQRILLFGFTFMVWEYFYGEILRSKERLFFEDAILIHSGGWKKLQERAVSNELFKNELLERCGIRRVHNFYGMVEQVGSIYMECEHGHFHSPNFADVIVRDFRNWEPLPPGESGIIQTLSVLPHSYPGHSLLTDDLGAIQGIDDCTCGRMGTHFSVSGRIPKAELRGCSDTHAQTITSGTGSTNTAITLLVPSYGEFLAPEMAFPEEFFRQSPLQFFDVLTQNFLSEVSQGIFRIPDVKYSPELSAIAYWLRKASVQQTIEGYLKVIGKNEIAMPRGVAFHVAPSNVDTIFLYSWALSMLAGNINIVRISQKNNSQVDTILEVLRWVIAKPEYRPILERNIILTYSPTDKINRYLSINADIRILWGGDNTVESIRSLPAKPVTVDIAFADKVSYTVVHSERYLEVIKAEVEEIANRFYNDAYQFNQLACSSPRVVYFMGKTEHRERASAMFWRELSFSLERKNHHQEPSVEKNKLDFTFQLASRCLGMQLLTRQYPLSPTVLNVPKSDVSSCRDTCGGGIFIECFIDTLKDLASIVQSNDQTLSYVKFTQEEMSDEARFLCVRGIDRIVPVGQALSFSAVWDGYVMFNELTRRIIVS